MKYLHERHFTIEEAKELLEQIRPLVSRMIELKRILDLKGYDIYRYRYFIRLVIQMVRRIIRLSLRNLLL